MQQHFSGKNIPSEEFLVSSYINVFLLITSPNFFYLFFIMKATVPGIQGLYIQTIGRHVCLLGYYYHHF